MYECWFYGVGFPVWNHPELSPIKNYCEVIPIRPRTVQMHYLKSLLTAPLGH